MVWYAAVMGVGLVFVGPFPDRQRCLDGAMIEIQDTSGDPGSNFGRSVKLHKHAFCFEGTEQMAWPPDFNGTGVSK